MKKPAISVTLILSLFLTAKGQSYRSEVKAGNELYKAEQYDEAEVAYKKALDEEKEPVEANFNLGNALYKQERYDEALEQYENASRLSKDKKIIAKAQHNIGNTYLQKKEYQEAINIYKSSLKNNSKDDQTRYNLAKALRELQQQQQNQQSENQEEKGENKKEQEQSQEEQKQQNQERNAEENEAQNQRPQESQENEQGQQKPQPKTSQISREDAERLLDALNRQEQELQKKLNEKKIETKPLDIEKDW